MSMFNFITSAIGLGANFGLTSLIGNVVGTITTKSGNKLLDKVTVGLGASVLTCMVGELTNNYVEKKAEEIRDAVMTSSAFLLMDSNNEENNDEDENENEPEIACGED